MAVFSLLLSPAVMQAGKKQPLPAGQPAGVISAILRNATLARPSMTDPRADYGTRIAWSDAVRTDGNGRVRVTLSNSSTVSMGSNSEVVFNGRDGETTSLTLTHGEMRFHPTNAERVEVHTPVAIVNGSGSDFAIDASVPGRVSITCLEGTTTIASPGSDGTSECDAGEMVTVKAGRAPYQPQIADATTLGIARNSSDPEEQPPVQYFP